MEAKMMEILKELTEIAEEMDNGNRKNQQKAFEVREKTANLSKVFAQYLGQNGYSFDDVRKNIAEIIG